MRFKSNCTKKKKKKNRRTACLVRLGIYLLISADTLNGISGYHQFWFPSLGLEVFVSRFSSFSETDSRCAQIAFSSGA